MKKPKLYMLCTLLLLVMIFCSSCNTDRHSNVPDEGTTELLSESSWIDSSGEEHTANFYTNGASAKKIALEANNIKLNHIIIDDIPIYEMYSTQKNNKRIVFFFHGQDSRKEEYLPEMINISEAGYVCVTVDLIGHGERTVKDAIMSVEVTAETAKDIDVLLEYYSTVPYADSTCFSLLGMSQGGSVAYWYAAYGQHKPSAMIIGSSTPDYKYQKDHSAVQNGKEIEPIWTDEEFSQFISNNNPINNVKQFIDIPILSGNGLDDEKVLYKGAEELEKEKHQSGYHDSQFYYYKNVGHDLTEDFMFKVVPFLNKNMKGAS